MWKHGIIEFNGRAYEWSAKVFDTCSEFGIDGGRISKLSIKVDGELVYLFDRGYDLAKAPGPVVVAACKAATA